MSSADSRTLQQLASFDPAVPHPARVYNVWLDGKDHFESDRAVAAKVIEQRPQVVDGAVANRQFLGRAVRHLARCYGVRQFIDIGTGLPAPDNTHEVAQLVDPYSRVLYVDNDPLVMTHARALLASTDEGSCDYLRADLRNAEYILKEARRTLDFNLPVAVLLLAVLHFIDDKDDPAGIVTALAGPLTAGSSVVISHLTADSAPEAVRGGVAAYNALVPTAIYPRTHFQVTELFGDLSLVPPGVVPVSEWRPDAVATQVTDVYAGMARKREAGMVSTSEPEQIGGGEAERWREVARLRNEHPDYVIIWLAPTRQFRAYPLKNARRADALMAVTAADLAEQISRAPPRRQ